MIIFTHIPRTAGTTLDRILRRQYRRDQIYLVDSAQTEASLRELHQRIKAPGSQIRLVMGHVPFGVDQSLPGDHSYFTILRDPVRRVLSLYQFMMQEPDHLLHAQAMSSGMTLREFVTSGISTEPDNGQTRAIAGDTSTGFGRCSEEMLARAKENLDDRFAVVGLTERFDETLLLLRREYGWRRLQYAKLNSSKPLSKQAVSASELAIVERHNVLDIELYRYAKARFQRDTASSGASFARELRRQRVINSLYRPWGEATYGIPRRAYHAFQRWTDDHGAVRENRASQR